MSYQSDNLDLEILEEGDPADLTTVSDNFDKIDAVAGDIATIETSPTQSSHAAGEFLLYEGRLYKVTSAISAGGSLILGTNVSAANIGNEIKSLKDLLDRFPYVIIEGASSTYAPSVLSHYAAIEAALPDKSCVVFFSTGSIWLGLYLYAGINYQSMFVFSYGGSMFHAYKDTSGWTLKSIAKA